MIWMTLRLNSRFILMCHVYARGEGAAFSNKQKAKNARIGLHPVNGALT